MKKSGIDVTKSSIGQIQEAVRRGAPLLNVTSVATHVWPHLDEIAALVLLTMYGERAFPGISESFELVSLSSYETRRSYGDNAWYPLLSEGILTVGTGGGPLDDHYEGGRSKKEGSATERVAYFLGIEKEPEIEHLIRYVEYTDNNGDNPNLTGGSGETARSAQNFMLATSIKSTWRMMRQQKREVDFIQKMKEFMETIRLHILDQKSFIGETGKVLSQSTRIPLELMSSNRITDPVLAVIRSDEERASDIVRSSWGKNTVAATLQIMSNGQFYLSVATKNGGVPVSQVDDLVKAIRSEIIRWKNRGGENNIRNDWRETQKEGYHMGTDELYYFRKGSMVFNGSLTQPDVPGLVGENRKKFPLTEKDLVDIVRIALEDQYWPKESRNECSSGKCPAKTPGSNFRCPIYHFGLYRCYQNRNSDK